MPRALDRINLTSSEENILNSKGYELSSKLGEGAYAKVCLFHTFQMYVKNEVFVCILRKGISQ